MTINQALKIFNLNNNFTDNELKKSYHKLARKYHPDNFSSEIEQKKAEEKMKEINNAKDLLERFLKNQNKTQQQPQTNTETEQNNNIQEYKRNLLNKLLKFKCKYVNNNELEKYNNEIEAIILWYEIKISKINNKDIILKLYENSLLLIKVSFDNFKNEFFRINDINENEIKEKINYDCNIEEFYSQLLKLKDKYNKKEIYRKKIKEDLHDYELRSGYSALKSIIDAKIDENLDKLKRNNYLDYEKFINELKIELDKLFTSYFSMLSKVNELLNIINNDFLINSKTMVFQKRISILYKKLKDGNFSNDVIKELDEVSQILNKIKNYKNNQQNQYIINEYIKIIINKYQNTLQSITYPQDLIKAKIVQKTFDEVLEIIDKVKKGEISIDSFKLLTNLTFINYNQDISIINKVKGINDIKNIYVLNNENRLYNGVVLGTIKYENNKDVIIQGFSIIGRNIFERTMSKQQFITSYITLEQCLNNCTYIGKKSLDYPNEIVLYYNDIVVFSYDEQNDIIRIGLDKQINNINYTETNPFENIYYTMNKINETLRKALEKKEKKKIL